MKFREKVITKIILISVVLCLGFIMSETVYAETTEREPNDTIRTAQTVTIGERYSGSVTDSKTDDEDYYRIPVKEGNFYKISIYNMADLDRYGWETMIVSLYKESNTNYGDRVDNGDYKNTAKLFRASYTGNYYLKFWNTTNTKYSFTVSKYSPVGKKVKDSDSNTYKITGNYTLEFAKVASKKNTDFYFSNQEYFSNISGIEILDYYGTPFTVTSIGKYAFKGSSIKSISIPEGVKKIGAGAFQNCKKLGTETYIVDVVIRGKKVTIGSKAFSGCKKLGTIRVLKSASIKSVKKNAFKGTKKGIRLEVPNVKKYKKIFKNAGLKKPKYQKGYI